MHPSEDPQALVSESSPILADKGLILFLAGQKNQAIGLLKQIETTEPAFLSPHAYLAEADLDAKDYKDYLSESGKLRLSCGTRTGSRSSWQARRDSLSPEAPYASRHAECPEKHEARATSVRVEHNLRALHDDPSFHKLVAQVGLPPLE
jgi:hypothetical protein